MLSELFSMAVTVNVGVIRNADLLTHALNRKIRLALKFEGNHGT